MVIAPDRRGPQVANEKADKEEKYEKEPQAQPQPKQSITHDMAAEPAPAEESS
jgi:hypothetical protein